MRKIIALIMAAAMCLTVLASAAEYTCSPWAEQYVNKAENLAIIPDSLKGADLTKPMTREEFAQLSVKLYEKLSGEKIEADESISFTDCTDPEVIKAATAGITNGMGNGKFEPAAGLNREQGATMLTRVYKKYAFEGWTLEKDAELANEFINSFLMPSVFSDTYSFSDWAFNSIYFMRARSIIDGVGDNKFAPKAGLTREQAIKIAVKMLAVIDNEYFAPMDAYLVDTVDGASLYTWVKDGTVFVVFYDADGEPVDKYTHSVIGTEPEEYMPYQQLCRTDYSRFGWYSGLAGMYRVQDGNLAQVTTKPVKDLLFVRCGPADSGPIILTWYDPSALLGIGAPADTIINLDCEGREAVLLSAEDRHGIEIAGLDAEDSVIAFYTENPVGMGHNDSYRYVLLSAVGGVPSPDGRKNIFVSDFTAGRPEVMDGFTYENPTAYKKGYIEKEAQRLKDAGLTQTPVSE